MRILKIFSALITVAALVILSSCFSFTTFEEMQGNTSTTASDYEYITSAQQTTSISAEAATSVVLPELTTVPQTAQPDESQQTTAPAQQTTAPAQQTTSPSEQPSSEQHTEQSGDDLSSYSKQQIIDFYAAAVNKTRAYSSPFSAVKTESFTAEVTDAHPGGALTELLASNIVKLVGSEGEQTLSFTGGRATDNEGNNVPVLLPQNSDFSLPYEGAASASISRSGDKTLVKITLVPETVSMGGIPKYNSGAVGYLDTSGMDFKIITISRVDITYTGSVIDAVIRSDGYIESVTYTVNMSTYAELSGMGISGYGTLEGQQTEKWTLLL